MGWPQVSQGKAVGDHAAGAESLSPSGQETLPDPAWKPINPARFSIANWDKYLLISRPLNCALAAVSEQIGDAALPQLNRVSIYSYVGETLHYLVY